MSAPAADPPVGPLLVERRGPVLLLTLHRPAARNALNVATRQALMAALTDAEQDDAVAAVVLTGTDPAFTGGVDLTEALSPGPKPRGVRSLNPAATLRAMTKPVVAAVNGPCITGGLEVLLSCSFAVASERARFADTHAGVGLVTELVAHEAVVARAVELAAAAALASRRALGATWALHAEGEGMSLAEALALEAGTARGWRVDPGEARDRFTAVRGAAARGGAAARSGAADRST
ncbi:enoyl-CoA hydratase-related protein [Frankia sp. QA3]|uniref:enoyl-CoA hydratase-related protein n=1 Tax=Frankia sp. QA3 TaxID=710111 RepID=UPI000269B649|nr:enoyl-CoA hydratase-related protein [Frankia sp. QA3]EIV90768.1 enoyl-CoA hydratase/carnithine racemase [Frankia sp. QA3]